MKTIKHIYYLLGIVLLLATSCSKDTGNYSYQNINNYFVDTSSYSKSIVIKQNESFSINPTLVNGVNGENLTYEWRLMQVSYAPDPATGTFFNKVLATTKNLTYKVTDAPGDYMLVFYAKDNANGGVTQMVKIPFFVSSYASIGWMVVHGDETACDVSIVVNNKLNSQLTAPTDYVQPNVFSETNGRKVEGEAVNVTYIYQHWVNVFTKGSKGGYRASGNDLRILNTYNNMFINPMPESEVRFDTYGIWSYNELLVNNGALYFTSQPVPTTYNPFGFKCFGEDYVAAPFLATVMSGAYYGVIYDSKNKRFLYIDYTRTVKPFKAPGASAAFNMTNVGKEMVYAEHGFDSRWFCIMQDQGNPKTREIYACKFNVLDDGNRAVAKYAISAGTELDNAKYFAFGNRGNVMFYATDKKIYQSNYSGDLSSTLRMDLTTSYPGYVITCMKVFKVTNHPNDGKMFFVAMYNESTKEGKLLQIDINEVTGLFGTVKEYTGFRKIAGMNYKAK